ncbi:MAG: TetR/AcrR family transcriptional regulator [Pseudomonadota bacterium]
MYNPDDSSPQIEATQALIRDKAKALFGHYGFSKTSIGDIAKACSMSPGNIYRYFRNKQAIGVAVVENFFDLQASRMLEARHVENQSVETRLRRTITEGVTHLVEMMGGNPRLFEMAEFLCEDPEGAELLARHRNWMGELLGELIAEGNSTGELDVADPDTAGWNLLLVTTAFWMPQALMAWHRHDMILDDLQVVLDMTFPAMRDSRAMGSVSG